LFPRARLSVLSKPVFAGFWKNFPGVDRALALQKGFSGFWRTASELQAQNFDAALILPTSFSSAFLAFAAGIPERIGWGGEGRDLFLTRVVPRPEERKRHLVLEYLELARKGFGLSFLRGGKVELSAPVTKDDRRVLRQVWEDTGVPRRGSFIALAPGAAYGAAKRWPLHYWRELVKRLLKERKERLLILGGMEEEGYLRPLLEEGGPHGNARRLHLLAGRTAPPILAAMLSRCKLLVTNDTGPMHVAAAVGTPTVALFGSTSPVWTRPFGLGHEVVYKHLECSPCFQRTCPIGYKCLHAISVGEVYRAVMEKLRKPRKVQGEPPPRNF
jgi:heptosyltransferase-2